MPTEIKGGVELLRALKAYTPDLAKATTKELGDVLRPMTNKARGFLPSNAAMLSGWTSAASSENTTNYRHFPKYEQGRAKRGVNYSVSPSKPNKSGFSSLAAIVNSSAAGAIYETAGRKNPNGQPSQASTRGKFSDYIDTSNKVNKSLNPNAGKQFIARANATGKLTNAAPRQVGQVGRATRKLTGRVIFRAFAEDQGRTTGAIVKAFESAQINFYKKTKKVN